MKFSIITVSFNSAATISKTLQSVAAQIYPDIEHIVIDGGSSDATLELVERFGERVSVIVSEPDEGIYDAMNKGLARASGDIVAFLNSDDHYAHPDVLARVAEVFAGTPSLDAVFGDIVYFRGSVPQKVVRRYRSSRFKPGRIAWGWVPAHPASFIRRTVYDRFGSFKTDFRIAGDFEFYARAFGRGALTYAYVPEVMAHMLIGGASTAGIASRVRGSREMMRACRDNGISTNWLKLSIRYLFKFMEYLA